MEESNECIWKGRELYKILINKMVNGEIKMARQKKKKLSKNGRSYIQMEKNQSVSRIQDYLNQRSINGGERNEREWRKDVVLNYLRVMYAIG